MKIIDKSGMIFYTGSVGNIIGYIKYGKQYFRKKPKHFNDAKSKKQVNQRTRFSACTKLAKSALNDMLKPVWKKGAITMTAFNLFIKTNLSFFDATGKISNYSNLKFSVGNLSLPEESRFENSGENRGEISLKWNFKPLMRLDKSTDRLCIIAMRRKELAIIQGVIATRKDGIATFHLPWKNRKDRVHLYACFVNSKNTKGSDTYYQLL
jgi:hypothetical protein